MKASKELMLDLYQRMVLIRVFEETTSEVFAKGEMPGFIHTSQGEEAMAAGTCANLRVDDCIFTTHRGHGACVAKGADLKKMMAELFGRVDGCCRGRAGSMHFADVASGCMGSNGIVGQGIPISVGTAFAQRYKETDAVTACFFGDGACNTGAFHEGINMAAVMKLPVIFILSNNLYAQMTSIKWHSPIENLSNRAAAYGMPGECIDGNDAGKVYEAVAKAVERARSGKGPTLIEGKTYRWHGHFEGDPCKYRPEGELEEWKKRDPVIVHEKKLTQLKYLNEKEQKKIWKDAEKRVNEAVEFARQSPLPGVEEIFRDLYAD
jgi:pyruvate dehydrogenase E1 component alpha subunit